VHCNMNLCFLTLDNVHISLQRHTSQGLQPHAEQSEAQLREGGVSEDVAQQRPIAQDGAHHCVL
jgi:hypothetical protein